MNWARVDHQITETSDLDLACRDLPSVMYEVGVVAITFPSPRHNNNPQRTGLRTPRSLVLRWLCLHFLTDVPAHLRDR